MMPRGGGYLGARQGGIRRERRPQGRSGRRLEEVAEAVGGGYCRLQMPLKLALGVRGTVVGHRLGALEGGGGVPPPSNAFLEPWDRGSWMWDRDGVRSGHCPAVGGGGTKTNPKWVSNCGPLSLRTTSLMWGGGGRGVNRPVWERRRGSCSGPDKPFVALVARLRCPWP